MCQLSSSRCLQLVNMVVSYIRAFTPFSSMSARKYLQHLHVCDSTRLAHSMADISPKADFHKVIYNIGDDLTVLGSS